MLNGKSIFITGGTGSFGKELVSTLVNRYPKLTRLVIFSRDELKQVEMSRDYPVEKYPNIRFFIGDVREKDRLRRAMEGIDVVIHAAALKQVPTAEYNPFEFIKTNIIGAQNVIDACFDSNVKQVVALSTDKAAAPINLYGATKLCSDKLFVAANNIKGKRDIRFSVVRYGNVMGSRGSVIPLFLENRQDGVLPITDSNMTRFNITLQQGVELVLLALEKMWGGEIFVPRIPSYRLLDLVEAIAPGIELKTIGCRPGEKVHEEMITETDAPNTVEFDDYFVILPSMKIWDEEKFIKSFNGRRCSLGFKYSSGTNGNFLSVEQIRELITKHVDSNFKVWT